jgi:uncharacterized metal-binding protein YceD (DUF177 family)
MKIHLKQIPPQGLHLKGEEDCPISELEAEEIRCVGPLSYDLEVGVSHDALWANGSLRQSVELRCVACLEAFGHQIRLPAFALHIELAGPEIVDITPYIREEILLNLPAHPHCDRDGGQICKAAEAKSEERDTKRRSDWSALDHLKLKR